MRRPKRPLGQQRRVGRQDPGDAGDDRGLKAIGEGHGRQQRRQAATEHGLARARRPDEQDVVLPGGGDLDGATSDPLTADVAQVGPAVCHVDAWALGQIGHGLMAGEHLDAFGQMIDAEHLDALDHRRLQGVLAGHDDALEAGPGGVGGQGEHPAHRANAAIEGQLADGQHALKALYGHLLIGGEDGEGHGQVVAGALLLDMGGREVDRDAALGEAVAAVDDGGFDAGSGLADRAGGQADGAEDHHAAAEIDLDFDSIGVDAKDGARADDGVHARPFNPVTGGGITRGGPSLRC